MNYQLIFRLIGFVMVAMAVAFLICSGVAYFYGESGAVFAFSISAGAAGAIGLMCRLIARGGETRFFRKEALAFIGVAWISASVIGALPFALLLPGESFADALFESASGFTTTGASVLSNLEDLPRSLIFWRSFTQWIGGLGVVVFFVAILGFLGAGGKILFAHESSGRSADFEQGRVRKGVMQLFLLYLGISAACLAAYLLCGMTFYDAICHMFSTVATGGFSTQSSSIGAFGNPWVEWVAILFMAIGGTNFFFLLLLLRRDWRKVKRFTEVLAYFGLLAGTTLLFLAFVHAHFGSEKSLFETIRVVAFQVTSIVTTTGFSSEDFGEWPLFTNMTLLVLMAIGGCSASTAGGMKIVRVVVAFRLAMQSVERSFRAHVVRPVMMNGRPLDDAARENIVHYILLLSLVFLVSLPIFGFFETGHSLGASVSAVVATLFNSGVGFAEFGPRENFGNLAVPTKIYLSLLMILGRLELFAILVLLAPSLWKKFS